MSFATRPADLDDREFAVSMWSRGFKSARSAGIIATEDWASVMHPTIRKILDRPTTRTLVAFERDDPDFVYGFIAGDVEQRHPVIYFVAVKDDFRQRGCARALFGALGIDPAQPFVYACDTPYVHKLRDRIPHAKHVPNVARYADMRSVDAWRP
jgi:hypothetical protein